MIRLLIADDHPVVRAGLRAMFEAEDDIDVVGEASTGRDAVDAAARLAPDVVLMDLQFGPGMQGVEATRSIRSGDHPSRVLILTNYGTDSDILDAVEAGASGYLLKDADPQHLVGGVRAAAAGKSALAPEVASRLMNQMANPTTRLTAREAEVLSRVADGQSNRDIGRALFLSEATVKSHLVHIFTKLGVASRTAAVARARETGAIR
ncbi:response regulator transcription factor [Solicola gregarius]|uniref:Response regulator transcription factor n=1 Tax=Solicola gregarius TaxID=2908642 RepID=A0AA46YKF5_9ACTN|nr:response regulator transcription factor [Solicola gregarius]UYM05715.1 response regulator transcription factor [Solicola gregarius]